MNVKLNRDWTVMDATDSIQTPEDNYCDTREPCAIHLGKAIRKWFGVSDSDDLWRECDDGMGDELIELEEQYFVWDGDRFYTAAKEINQG